MESREELPWCWPQGGAIPVAWRLGLESPVVWSEHAVSCGFPAKENLPEAPPLIGHKEAGWDLED